MNFDKAVLKSQQQIDGSMRKTTQNIERGMKKTTKDIERGIKKASNIQIKQLISKEGRARINAERRHEVEDKYGGKCAVCKSKPRGVTLQIHHKNGKNNDNRSSNLVLLCPNHHYAKHTRGSKLNKTIRKRSARRSNPLGWGF